MILLSHCWQWNVPNSEQCNNSFTLIYEWGAAPDMVLLGVQEASWYDIIFSETPAFPSQRDCYSTLQLLLLGSCVRERLMPQILGVSQTYVDEKLLVPWHLMSWHPGCLQLWPCHGASKNLQCSWRSRNQRVDSNQHYLFRVDSPLTYLLPLWICF